MEFLPWMCQCNRFAAHAIAHHQLLPQQDSLWGCALLLVLTEPEGVGGTTKAKKPAQSSIFSAVQSGLAEITRSIQTPEVRHRQKH